MPVNHLDFVIETADDCPNRMNPRDLSPVLKNAPPGEWIAMSSDQTRMVGHGPTIDDAVKSAKEAGEEKPVLIKMPLANTGLAASIA